MTGLSKSDTELLARSLELQGCRLERPSTSGGYPIRVYFPDGEGSTVLHGTVADRMAVTLKRTEIRRAGLTWPFDDKAATKRLHKQRRQEQGTMSTETTPKPSREELNPLGHVRFPPGAREFPAPLERSVQPVLDVLKGVQAPFWTDQALSALLARGVPGYKGNAGMQRLQGMLDWLGYRVVETKRNRNGYSYRWEPVPNYERPPFADRVAQGRAGALAKAAQRSTASVTPIKPKLPEPPKLTPVDFPPVPTSPTVEKRKALHDGVQPIVVEPVHPDTSASNAEVEAAMAMATEAEAEATRLKREVERLKRELAEAERLAEKHRQRAMDEIGRRNALADELAKLKAAPVAEAADVWPLNFGELGGTEPMTLDSLEAMLRAMGLEAMLRRVA